MKVDELRKEIENNSLKNVYLVLGKIHILIIKLKNYFGTIFLKVIGNLMLQFMIWKLLRLQLQ